ncbi:MAG: transcriptional regulator [Acidithiobacillales bacterium SM23_46]|jgi:regulator of PEP synthase PpsR (kinase-PPPase family)|nr:MAG: transcriptional regulator [Acidithiobacillales bacterium SM23_46]KPL27753.1 MAG: transcriptional regulator [Acidithiobacillales bacterium SM1_46]
MSRSVFYLSDRTGITAETLAHSLLTQFEGIAFTNESCPYLDSVEKAHEIVTRINAAASRDGLRPLLFSTLIDPAVREVVATSDGLLIDFFDTFIQPLESELGVRSSHAAGRSHGLGNYGAYKARIDAVNFALGADDGLNSHHYPQADIILLGVSRTGKTPSCLYFALQYGILAANYPLTEDDFAKPGLPTVLRPFRQKLFGLTIRPDRLREIRQERRPDSRYASLAQCESEIRAASALMRAEGIVTIDTSTMSVEEIVTTILHQTKLHRRLYG